MAQIQLDDHVFATAKRHAADGGYASVEEYIADIVTNDKPAADPTGTPNLDHLFTPERLAEIDKAAADVKAGNYYTAEQVREHFKQKRAEWQAKSEKAVM
jgi:hypothetical protein